MNIPIHADVESSEGKYGHSTRLVVDRVTRKITYIVVKESGMGGTERLVPADAIVSADNHKIVLGATNDQLDHMEPFKSNAPASDQALSRGGGSSPGTMWEFIPAMPDQLIQGGQKVNLHDFDTVAIHENIGDDELVANPSARVEAINGSVGKLVSLVADPESKVVSEFIMRESHIIGHRDVVVPVDAIDYVLDGVIHLGLDKQQVKDLPGAPV